MYKQQLLKIKPKKVKKELAQMLNFLFMHHHIPRKYSMVLINKFFWIKGVIWKKILSFLKKNLLIYIWRWKKSKNILKQLSECFLFFISVVTHYWCIKLDKYFPPSTIIYTYNLQTTIIHIINLIHIYIYCSFHNCTP